MRRTRFGIYVLLLLAWSAAAFAEFSFEETSDTLVLREDGRDVLTYRAGRVDPPSGLDAERLWRASYIHPLMGMHSEVITQDFPADHYHHRGVFWTWPESRAGDRKMDVWTLVGARQLFSKWLTREVYDDRARFGVENVWRFDNDPASKIRETVYVDVHAVSDDARALDLFLRFENISDEPFTFEGAKDKGYGGFCFRPDAAHKPLTFVTADGEQAEDLLQAVSPWAAVFWTRADSGAREGVAIFQHPANPDYPHEGWVLRHYGLLGAAWPHEEQRTFAPGEGFTLQYRLMVYGEERDAATISTAYGAYVDAAK